MTANEKDGVILRKLFIQNYLSSLVKDETIYQYEDGEISWRFNL